MVGEGPKSRRLLEKPSQEQKYGGDRRKRVVVGKERRGGCKRDFKSHL